MKVSELLTEASYYKPRTTKELKSKTEKGEKVAAMRGSVPDWLEAINSKMKTPVTKEHIKATRSAIKHSPEYRELTALGFKDISSEAAEKRGTFIMQKGKQKFNFLVTGKINDRSQRGGGERPSTLPRIVPNDPSATVLKTMTRSMAHFAATQKKLAAKEHKQFLKSRT